MYHKQLLPIFAGYMLIDLAHMIITYGVHNIDC